MNFLSVETTVISHLEEAQVQGLDDVSRAILFRNVRELMINVAKHSQAGSVRILLERAGDNLELTVRDDGEGCDSDTALDGRIDEGGLGLFGIRERMADLGGALEVETGDGRGFAATLVMPLVRDRSTASG